MSDRPKCEDDLEGVWCPSHRDRPDAGGWCDKHRPIGFTDDDGYVWTNIGWTEQKS